MTGWNKKSQYNSPERKVKMPKSVQKTSGHKQPSMMQNIHFPSPGQGTAINEIYQRKLDKGNMNYKKYMRSNVTQQNFSNFKQNMSSIEKAQFYKQQIVNDPSSEKYFAK